MKPDSTTAPPGPAVDPALAGRLLQMATGHWVSQCLYVAARLDVAGQLRAGPRTAEDLAKAVGARPRPLFRVLRALASVGVFAREADGRFRSTPLSAALAQDAPGSLRALVMTQNEWNYRAYASLFDHVTTPGPPGFERVFGAPFYAHMERDAHDGQLFDAAMQGLTEQVHAAAAEAYDFAGARTIVDVGGGTGALLARVLARNRGARGVLVELPRAAARAREHLARAGVAGRVEVVEGDFFQAVPGGGDVYILSRILHGWDDDGAGAILANVRKAIPPHGRLLVFEDVLPEDDAPSLGKFLDITLMLTMDGMERTATEYRQLLRGAGFRLLRAEPTKGPVHLQEAAPEG